jgi:hypothetical protein
MRASSSLVGLVFASVFVGACAVDATGASEQGAGTTDQAMSEGNRTPEQRPAPDFYRVDLVANSAGGTCFKNEDSGGRCNLRAALLAASLADGPTTIELAVDSTIDEGPIELAAPAPGKSYEVTIRSPEGEEPKAITGFAWSRFINVPSGVSLDLHNVVISGFAATDEGGAILNHGTVHLHKVTLFDNRTVCEGTGALQAFAPCGGGAVANYGSLLVNDGTRFESNRVLATAMIAAFPTATAVGGAVANYGNLVIDGQAVFAINFVSADAWPGDHPVTGMATANAFGGAVFNGGGTVLVKGVDQGCNFFGNQAWALASGLYGADTVTKSRGGAIASIGGMLEIGSGACQFKANGADEDSDVYNAL